MHDEPRDCDPATANDDLVVQARTDRASLGLLYDRYYPRIARYCRRRLFDPSAAEDVTSEIFLHVASHMRAFTGSSEAEFCAWLFRIATNAVNAHVRQSRRRGELWQAAARRGQLAAEPAGPAHEPLDWLLVYEAIRTLDERDQTIIMLRFFADCTHEEIARIVETTPGAARTALCRALERLRRQWQENTCDRPSD